MRDAGRSAAQTGRSVDFITHSPAQSERIGQRLGALLQAGDLLLFSGTLGAGKTQLIKGIAQGLGCREAVTSPTFVLVNEYLADRAHGRLPVYHIDLYRLGGVADLESIGLSEITAGDGVVLIEWPERAERLLSEDHLLLLLQHVSETKRRIQLIPHGRRAEQLLQAFKEETFG
jgi:tRNA threonylcarbamoyladenosine biosynthesis protein TsaE